MRSTRNLGSLSQALAAALVFAAAEPAQARQAPPRPRGPRPAEGYPPAPRSPSPEVVQHNLLVDMKKKLKKARKAQR